MQIISRDEYINMIVNPKDSSTTDTELTPTQRRRLLLALTYALKNRKTEIESYWRRAQYFWGFLVTIYGGYVVVFTSSMPNSFFQQTALLLLSLVGYFFSVGWFLSNRGSAFWQENWEYHVRELEKEVFGPLHSIVATNISHYKRTSWHAPFPYSVNKINCILSLLFVILGLVLAISNFCTVLGSLGLLAKTAITICIFAPVIAIITNKFERYVHKGFVRECKKNCEDNRHPIFFSDHNTRC